MTTSDGAGPTVQGEDDSGGLREQYEVDRTLQGTCVRL